MTTGQAAEIRAGMSRIGERMMVLEARLADLRAAADRAAEMLEAARGELALVSVRLVNVSVEDGAGEGRRA